MANCGLCGNCSACKKQQDKVRNANKQRDKVVKEKSLKRGNDKPPGKS